MLKKYSDGLPNMASPQVGDKERPLVPSAGKRDAGGSHVVKKRQGRLKGKDETWTCLKSSAAVV